ncbi:hypothetical protein D9613_008005 [Agrocybe pediades]|uniref:Carboxylic ester hydrolase n=1 Tax=Agrocybe pediades TaxID=84607 RepID=A0A8H4QLS0_9AGAR|nr:hypothetical protein D9613_008005 [Agrocybe pediades]
MPPTGTSRFAAPKPPLNTPAVQLAYTEPPFCYLASPWGLSDTNPFSRSGTALPLTPETGDFDPQSSEDCLFLNVVTPGKLGDKKNLPVVVWIYGASDSGIGILFDGNDLVRASGGEVVAVAIQYRAGLFGFLAGQKVKEGGALNAGLLNQQFALQWVQKHIAKFGGDPRKVTIWGESAGAGSVLQHVVANGGKTKPSLFRAAMTSSTFLPSQYQYNSRIPEAIYNQVLSLTNCTTAKDSLECLRHAPIEVLQAANAVILHHGFYGTFTFVPVVDGSLIIDNPTKLIQQGKVNTKHVYSVTNSFEGAIFIDPTKAATMQVVEYVSQLYPTLSSRDAAVVSTRYSSLGSNATQAALVIGESIFICPTYTLLSPLGRDTFKAEFAFPPGTHSADEAYYYNAYVASPLKLVVNFEHYCGLQWDSGKFADGVNVDAATTFAQPFMNFVKHLDPSVQDTSSNISLANWKTWNGRNELVFNQTSAGAPDVRPGRTSIDLLSRCQ